jgi:hypothetical protein
MELNAIKLKIFLAAVICFVFIPGKDLIASADYKNNLNELQYITILDYQGGKRYILGAIDQNTFGFTFRMDLNITSEFSVQYYGSPFISKGTYSDYKYVTDPEADSYADRFEMYNYEIMEDGSIGLDENRDYVTDYSIGNPNYNFQQLCSNFVAKWEYRPGSFICFVWSGEKTGQSDMSEVSLGESYKQLKNVFPNNIFLIKLNYWFSL